MAVDFDFDTDYNDDADNQPEETFDPDLIEPPDFEDTGEFKDAEEFDEDDNESTGRSPLRLILLALLVLVLLCGVCYLASRFVPLPFGGSAPPPAPAPVQDTPTPVPVEEDSAAVDESAVTEGAEEGAADVDQTQPEEDASADESVDTAGGEIAEGEVTEGEVTEPEAPEGGVTEPEPSTDKAGTEDTDEAAGEGNEVDAGESGEAGEAPPPSAPPGEEETTIIVVTPVPGPTATPAPQDQDTEAAAGCNENSPPVSSAGGPYEAMMGKGQAIVTFDGSSSSDGDGTLEIYAWVFSDGESSTGVTYQRAFTKEGSYQVTLTVTDNCGATSQSSGAITILAAAPPDTDKGDGEDSDSDTPEHENGDTDNGNNDYAAPAPTLGPALGTQGFCYRVQPGNTLSGIAWKFGVQLPDLAFVNGVSTEYYVIAGQGLFVPVGIINPHGPNIYQVQPGDTMPSLAYRCGMTATDLAHVNRISPDATLTPGQIVTIPPPWSY